MLTLANPRVPDVAVSSLALSDEPIIQYNPAVLGFFSAVMRRFWYMHECGHHALGHVVRNIPLSQEQESDCFAILSLVRSGEFSAREVQQVQLELSQITSSDWQHLPGPQRAINLARCPGLNVPIQAPANPDLDRDSDPEPNSKSSVRSRDGFDRMDAKSARETIGEELTNSGDTVALSTRPEAAHVIGALRQARGRLSDFAGGSHEFELRRIGGQAAITYQGPDKWHIFTGAHPGEEVLRFSIPLDAGRWKRINTDNNTWGLIEQGRMILREGYTGRSQRCSVEQVTDVALLILTEGDEPTTLLLRTDPVEEMPRYSYSDGCRTSAPASKQPLWLELRLRSTP